MSRVNLSKYRADGALVVFMKILHSNLYGHELHKCEINKTNAITINNNWFKNNFVFQLSLLIVRLFVRYKNSIKTITIHSDAYLPTHTNSIRQIYTIVN